MMTKDRIAFWQQIHDYAEVMELYLETIDLQGIDMDKCISETEAEIWAMVDKYRKEESD